MEDNSISIPGFRFYPTEEELLSFYLHNKLDEQREELNRVINRVIPLLDIYEFNPWDLPQYSGVPCQGDPEQCFFFIPRQESEARGGRPSRLTESGYWKATGSPSYVYSSKNRIIGLKRTMVFYTGRAPNGKKTQWKMNEYKAIQGEPTSSGATPMLRQELSLCRVYKKTKCLRAFDRRPTREEINFNPTIRDDHDHHQQTQYGHDHDDHLHQEATSSSILSRHETPTPPPPPPPAPMIIERTSSPDDSTSSGGGGSGGQPCQSGESDQYLNLQMPPGGNNDEALWDWDHMMNFFSLN